MNSDPQKSRQATIQEGLRVLKVETEALQTAMQRIDESFALAVEMIQQALAAGGKIVVSGVGKSGNVAQKVAATLTSTGSMAIFLHPTEALHGDLGLLGEKDMLIVFSQSGSSQEILLMLPSAREMCKGVVAILGNSEGSLAPFANVVISSHVPKEACPDNLAPTASSTVAMAIGDAIAMSLKMLAGFGPDRFARFHPGGRLGKRLLTTVADLMHKQGEFAQLPPDSTVDDVVIALTKFRHSGVCIVESISAHGNPRLVGVITEGDIRKALSKKERFFQLRAQDIMTKRPITVNAGTKAAEALDLMENREGQLSFLPVVDADLGCIGVLRIHDLVASGLN